MVYNHIIQEKGFNRSKNYEVIQKKLIESNFGLILKNNLNSRWYCHWTTPITYEKELVLIRDLVDFNLK
jgi:hypothetical protein